MTEEDSRLLWDWHNEKGNFESFLADPLEWVAKELEKACKAMPFDRPFRKGDLDTIVTLTDIIRFINLNKALTHPN